MLDVGWSELIVVIVVAVLVIGPKDIPKAMMSLGKVVRRLQYIKYALSQQFEDLMKETDLQELRDVNALKSKNQLETNEGPADAEAHDSEKGGEDDHSTTHH